MDQTKAVHDFYSTILILDCKLSTSPSLNTPNDLIQLVLKLVEATVQAQSTHNHSSTLT